MEFRGVHGYDCFWNTLFIVHEFDHKFIKIHSDLVIYIMIRIQ